MFTEIPPNEAPVNTIGIFSYSTSVVSGFELTGNTNQLPELSVLSTVTVVVPISVIVYGPPEVVNPPILDAILNFIPV